jgi:hypothetical protein
MRVTHSLTNRVPLTVLALTVFSCAAAADPPVTTPAVQAAVWTPRQIAFQYTGFTTKYTCDGLRDKMRSVLTMLGAQQVQLTSFGCLDRSTTATVSGVYIKMSVLQPVGATAKAQAVPALWQPIDLLAKRDLVDAAADCELIYQIKLKILPLFAARSVEYSADCAAHQLLLGGTKLTAEVLMPEYAPSSAVR